MLHPCSLQQSCSVRPLKIVPSNACITWLQKAHPLYIMNWNETKLFLNFIFYTLKCMLYNWQVSWMKSLQNNKNTSSSISALHCETYKSLLTQLQLNGTTINKLAHYTGWIHLLQILLLTDYSWEIQRIYLMYTKCTKWQWFVCLVVN